MKFGEDGAVGSPPGRRRARARALRPHRAEPNIRLPHNRGPAHYMCFRGRGPHGLAAGPAVVGGVIEGVADAASRRPSDFLRTGMGRHVERQLERRGWRGLRSRECRSHPGTKLPGRKFAGTHLGRDGDGDGGGAEGRWLWPLAVRARRGWRLEHEFWRRRRIRGRYGHRRLRLGSRRAQS